jgi:DNA-binding Lrp family transcriptional regulator
MYKDEARILMELQKNSNESIDTIAKNCGFSRQKVWRIIKQLEANQTIWGYTAIIGEQKQDLQKFMLSLQRSLQPLQKETVESIARSRLEKKYLELGITIEGNYYLHGEYDWAIIFTAKDIKIA